MGDEGRKPAPDKAKRGEDAIRALRAMSAHDFLRFLCSDKVIIDKNGWVVLEDDGDTD